MNTTEKGDLFEKKVFKILKELLSNDEFFLPGKRSEIHSKKEYDSKYSRSKIIADISIETFMPGSKEYSLLTIVECKYRSKSPISVDKIRTLSRVLDEISDGNTKGVLISNSHFQQGVIDNAKSTGIALGRVNIENKIDWINYRIDKKERINSLNSPEEYLYSPELKDLDFYGYFNNAGFDKLPELLIKLGIIDTFSNKLKYVNIPFVSPDETQNTINAIPDITSFYNPSLDFSKLCSYLEEKEIEFEFDKRLESGVLGKITFNPTKIYVTNALEFNQSRWRFTLAHEIGHLMLHEKILNQYFSEKLDYEDSIFFNKTEFISTNKHLETQANIFASLLLMPESHLLRMVAIYFREENINKGRLYLDHQGKNISVALKLLGRISSEFNVSKSAAKYRLIRMGLLEDKSDTSVRKILKTNKLF